MADQGNWPLDTSISKSLTFVEVRRTLLQNPPDQTCKEGQSSNHERGLGTMEPPQLRLRFVWDKTTGSDQGRTQPQPLTTEVGQTLLPRGESLQQDGEDLRRNCLQAGSYQADDLQEDEKVASMFKKMFSDSFLSAFTDNLGSSLNKINVSP